MLSAVPATGVDAARLDRAAATPRRAHRFVVMALDRKTGKIVWERTAREEAPHEGTHNQSAPTPRARRSPTASVLIASFESRGIYAYDLDGTRSGKDLGDKTMRNEFGEGSTPALYKDRVVVVWDHQGESFIVALDKKTGKELWRTKRDEIDTWATPLVVEANGKPQVVTGGMNRVRSYDLGDRRGRLGDRRADDEPDPVAGGRRTASCT